MPRRGAGPPAAARARRSCPHGDSSVRRSGLGLLLLLSGKRGQLQKEHPWPGLCPLPPQSLLASEIMVPRAIIQPLLPVSAVTRSCTQLLMGLGEEKWAGGGRGLADVHDGSFIRGDVRRRD